MSKSILYAANTNSQAILVAGTIVNFGSIVRKYGCNCTLSGGNAEVTGVGYYDIETNITFTPTATGTATAQVYKDGVVIPGAFVSFTTTAAEEIAFTIPAVIRQFCNCTDTITVEISGGAGTVSNAAITVIKL